MADSQPGVPEFPLPVARRWRRIDLHASAPARSRLQLEQAEACRRRANALRSGLPSPEEICDVRWVDASYFSRNQNLKVRLAQAKSAKRCFPEVLFVTRPCVFIHIPGPIYIFHIFFCAAPFELRQAPLSVPPPVRERTRGRLRWPCANRANRCFPEVLFVTRPCVFIHIRGQIYIFHIFFCAPPLELRQAPCRPPRVRESTQLLFLPSCVSNKFLGVPCIFDLKTETLDCRFSSVLDSKSDNRRTWWRLASSCHGSRTTWRP